MSDADRTVIRRGLTQVEAYSTGDGRVRVVRRKLKHTFNQGYEPVGPEREIYEGNLHDAPLVADVLTTMFESEGDDTTTRREP